MGKYTDSQSLQRALTPAYPIRCRNRAATRDVVQTYYKSGIKRETYFSHVAEQPYEKRKTKEYQYSMLRFEVDKSYYYLAVLVAAVSNIARAAGMKKHPWARSL